MQSHRGAKYSEIRPNNIENDLYNYHLQQLVKKAYIKKDGHLYDLTTKGKKYISRLNAVGEKKDFFKVSIIAVAFRNNYKEVLLQKRKRKPFYGDIATIAGKIQKGEKIVDAAKRKFEEETGLVGDFKFIGVLRKIKRHPKDTVVEDTFYHYCIAEDPSGDLIEENAFGMQFWAKTKEALEHDQKNVDIGEFDIKIWKHFIKEDFSPFYFEQDTELREY